MGELSSKLFTTGDADAVKKLDNCATGRPTEVQSHFTQGMSGEAVKKLQQALQNAVDTDPDPPALLSGMPSFSINGKYDKDFADAIEFYKTQKGILNFAGKIDRIVGIKTIHELDKDATHRNQVNPDPHPAPSPGEHKRALKNCTPDEEVPLGEVFTVRILFSASGGEGVELSKFWFTMRDHTNELSSLYLMTSIGGGIGALPFQASPIPGSPSKEFKIRPTKVTQFSWSRILSYTSDVSGLINLAGMQIQYKDGEGHLGMTNPISVDTGPINIPGFSGALGVWSILSLCRGKPGATRHVIDYNDLIFGNPKNS